MNRSDLIFIIDDNENICLALQKVLGAEGYQTRWTTDPEEFLAQLHQNRVGCAMLDLKLKGCNGIDYLSKIREIDPHLPVIMITGYGDTKTAVEAMNRGAFHYLSKPLDNEELKALVANALTMRHLYWRLQDAERSQAGSGVDLEAEMGPSLAVRTLIQRIQAVAKTDVSVLLIGKTGTGKEFVARAIHQLSSRRGFPWVPIDCASLPESLIESELFGHEKGAFTGAHISRPGKLEQGAGGTLFLDELSNIPLTVQAKLLRFLETRTFERIGGRTPISVSVRIIAAANCQIHQLIEEGTFRQDLFHRLNEFPIELPLLRERTEDIPYLALRSLKEFEDQVGKSITGISKEAIAQLQCYHWPGNVRELRNAIKQSMVVASGRIEKSDLPDEIRHPTASAIHEEMVIPIRQELPLLQATEEAVSRIEKKLIMHALSKTNGRKGKAAQLLGIDEKTLYNKLKVYKIS